MGGLLRPGKTIGMYPHLTKASMLLRRPANWTTPGAQPAGIFIRKACDFAFLAQSFASVDSLSTLIRRLKLDNVFAMAASLAF